MTETPGGPVLDRDFEKIDESLLWELYARRRATDDSNLVSEYLHALAKPRE
jgi:hypothetical protein